MIRWLLAGLPDNIDDRLGAAFGRRGLAGIQVDAKAFAPYRFVDLFKATDEYFATRENVTTIESEHEEALNTLLHGKASRWVSRRIKRSQNIAWPVGPGEEVFLPIDRFWVSGSGSAQGGDRLVTRLRYNAEQDAAILEVAADTGALAEDIGFILTTNAIDRMEAAIKDRPGRISQCVYFGPPKAELRRRYLEHYLRHYATAGLDMERLVVAADGTTQAFLKEWVHRSVQIGLERGDGGLGDGLKNEDFHLAMAEMKAFSEGTTGRIIGFHVR